MALKRVEWTCPGCGKRYAIPAHVPEPKLCPTCRSRPPAPVEAADAPFLDPPPMMPVVIDTSPRIEIEPPDIEIPQFETEPPPIVPMPIRSPLPARAVIRKRYPALRVVIVCYKFLAALVAIGALAGVVAAIVAVATTEASPERTINILAGLGSFAAGLIGAVTLFAFGELIQVQLDIEENTRKGMAAESRAE